MSTDSKNKPKSKSITVQSAIDRMIGKDIDVYIKTSSLFGDNIKNVFDEAIYRAYVKKNGKMGDFIKDDNQKEEEPEEQP